MAAGPCRRFGLPNQDFLLDPLSVRLQPRDIDINPLAHHSGSRLSYLGLLNLIATAQRQLVGRVADHELIGDPLRRLLALGVLHGAQRRIAEEDAARLLASALDLEFEPWAQVRSERRPFRRYRPACCRTSLLPADRS